MANEGQHNAVLCENWFSLYQMALYVLRTNAHTERECERVQISSIISYSSHLPPPPTLSCCTIDSHRSSFMPNQYSPATGELIRFHIQAPTRPHSRSHLSRSLALVIILISLMYRNRRVVICRCCVCCAQCMKIFRDVCSFRLYWFLYSLILSHIAFAV